MASAMEKMVASMLGITPEEMASMMTGFQGLLLTLKGTLERIETQGQENAAALAAIMERLDNDGNSSRGKRSAKPASIAGAPGSGSSGGNAGSGDGGSGEPASD